MHICLHIIYIYTYFIYSDSYSYILYIISDRHACGWRKNLFVLFTFPGIARWITGETRNVQRFYPSTEQASYIVFLRNSMWISPNPGNPSPAAVGCSCHECPRHVTPELFAAAADPRGSRRSGRSALKPSKGSEDEKGHQPANELLYSNQKIYRV